MRWPSAWRSPDRGYDAHGGAAFGSWDLFGQHALGFAGGRSLSLQRLAEPPLVISARGRRFFGIAGKPEFNRVGASSLDFQFAAIRAARRHSEAGAARG